VWTKVKKIAVQALDSTLSVLQIPKHLVTDEAVSKCLVSFKKEFAAQR
jgi:hypothetical protein